MEPQCQLVNGWLKVGNGGAGAVSSACAVPVHSLSVGVHGVFMYGIMWELLAMVL
jgi:hypothetical protein